MMRSAIRRANSPEWASVCLLLLLLSGCAQSATPLTASPSALHLGPETLSYPATYVGGIAAAQATTLSNTGNIAIAVDSVTVSGSGEFAATNSCPPALPPHESCTLWVSFAPSTAGQRAGGLTVGGGGTAQTMTLLGIGVANPPPAFPATLNGSTVFMGASIVQYWPMPENNRGISGQVTAQMLARFATDVLGHGFQRVVILGGSNDITGGFDLTGTTIANLAAMAQMARAAGMEVVLSQLPPITLGGVSFNAQVLAANAAIQTLAVENGYLVVDYYTPMAAHPEYFIDGEHPNAAGYAVMEGALAATVSR